MSPAEKRSQIRGERTCSIAVTEPGAGSDAAAIKTPARRDGDGWRLTGGKHFISDGPYSDFFVVTAVTDPGAGARGISLFLVDKGMEGFTVGRDQKMMGCAAPAIPRRWACSNGCGSRRSACGQSARRCGSST